VFNLFLDRSVALDMSVRWPITRRVPLEQVSRFAGNLATCLEAGMGVPQSLRTSTGASTAVLPNIAQAAAEGVASGDELSDALEPYADRFPPFFIPVIRCGERVGRLDEALRYLERHCMLLVGPTRAMRNTWLYPLVIVVFGSIFKLAAYAVLAPLAQTLAYLGRTAVAYGIVAAVLWFFLAAPQAKLILDHAKLLLPIIGQVERELALNRFFHSLNMLYSTGGMRVEAMIKLAARAVGNIVVRDDLLRAARVIEAGGSITDAFAAPKTLTEDQRATVAAGDEAGKLEEAFATISRQTGESVQHRLRTFNEVSLRIVAFVVVFSIAGTLMSLIMTVRPGR
jgi:type II secretory pathway component PulF